MSGAEKITRLSLSTAAGFRGPHGTLTETLSSGVSGGRLSWELIAGALADPRGDPDLLNRLPVAEYARLLVLGEASDRDLARLLHYIGGTKTEAHAALVYAVHMSPCRACNGLGKVRGGLRVCARCEGTGQWSLGERQVSDLLGITRHEYRARQRVAHRERVGRVIDLHWVLEARLR